MVYIAVFFPYTPCMLHAIGWKLFLSLVSIGRRLCGNRGPRVWHFAYGANLGTDMWEQRGLDVAEHHDFVLEDHVLAFTHPSPYEGHGFADVLPKNLSQVYGKLLLISVWDMWRLDAMELVPFFRRHRKIWLHQNSKRLYFYRGHVVDRTIKPTHTYVERMKQAYQASGLRLLEHEQILQQVSVLPRVPKQRRAFVFCRPKINAPRYNAYLSKYDQSIGRLVRRWYPHRLSGDS